MVRKSIFLFLILTVTFFSCQKETQTINPSQVITIDNTIAIYDLLTINDSTLLAAGGIRNSSGKIYLSVDGGQTWQKTWESHICIYTLYAQNDTTIFAGGDSITVLKSTDNGKNWESLMHYGFVDWQEFVTPVQNMYFINADTGFAVGGDNQNKGILCSTKNGGKDWKFQGFNNELHAVIFDSMGNGYILGYGKIFKSADYGNNWTDNNFSGDNLQATTSQNQTLWACGYRGNIYNNEGNQWHTVFNVSSWNNRIHWRDMIATKNKNLLTVGNHGLVWFYDQNKLMSISGAPDFLLVTETQSGLFFAGTNDGRIFVFSDSQ